MSTSRAKADIPPILVVDDNVLERMMVREPLEQGGFRVLETEDGDAGIRAFHEHSPCLVLLDVKMPGLDGFEVCTALRSDPEGAHVPIIMMTGYTELHRVIEARDAGVTEIIAKPVSLRSLYSRIVAVIERPRPFIRTPNYFGPDRRRRQIPIDFEDRRLTSRQIRTEAEAAAMPNAGADIDVDWD